MTTSATVTRPQIPLPPRMLPRRRRAPRRFRGFVRRVAEVYVTEPLFCEVCSAETPHARRRVAGAFWEMLCRRCSCVRRDE